ncbi:MAG: penicillin-binding protein 2 [Candidatus Omnitrophica bacterium]|nr:penicillin-binding protein 2 [Candidatus Omnitrophota bacterium]
MNLYRLEKTFGFSFLFLVIFLWYYQILRGEYFSSLSEKNRIRVIPLFAERGKILDRKGRVLATQEPVLNIVANPAELKNKEEVFREVSSVLGISEEELFMRYKENLTSPFMPIVLVRDIPLEKLFLIEEKRPAFSGIEIEINQKRFYPFGSAGAHLLGYLGEIGPEELLKWKPYGYRIKNLLGKMGIEKSLETYLRGEDGARIIEVDNLGNLVRIMGEKKPIPGKTVQLSIDGEWQKIAHRLLNGKRGAILIMDVQTGEILVLESSPSFDPNLFSSREARKIRLLLNSPQAILLNRATQVNIPPGSIFKLVTALAGLSNGKISSSTQHKCEGKFFLGDRQFNCWLEEGHGYETVEEAIKHSCNIFFYKLGLDLGIDKILQTAHILGLGEKTGLEIEENKGFLPTPKWKQTKFKEKWFDGDTVNFSIGQGYILVTPLQILRLIACLANGGFLLRPQFIKNIEGLPAQTPLKEYTGIPPAILKTIREGMFRVVNEENGTGARMKIEGLEIAAKTATVQTNRGNSHALVAGFLPFAQPKLCFVIFLEYGGRGGVEAAELGYALFTALRKEIQAYR